MSSLAIIPARGGSKRIPRKNIKEFLGKPIINYSIENALKSGLFDEVMVSTDDFEVANISLERGANVPFMRSLDNSNDFATTFDVILEVMNKYNELGITFDNVCCIYPCAPLLTTDIIKEGYSTLVYNEFDSVFPVVQYSTPINRAFRMDGLRVLMNNSKYINSRSQDLEKFYYDAGQFYWLNWAKICLGKKIFTDNSGAIILNEIQVQDIDYLSDWQIAELKYKLINT